MPGKVFENVHELRTFADEWGIDLITTSGGFDPMHVGHLRCIQQTAEIARELGNNSKVVVIVNGDGFLKRKKNYSFMNAAERMEIIAGVAGVDYVVPWDDGGQTVTGALEVLRPVAFTKGGDRDAASNVPEFDICEKIGCRVIFGVGGGKIQSSSDLVKMIKEAR